MNLNEIVISLLGIGISFIAMILAGESSRKADRMLKIISVKSDLLHNEMRFETILQSGDSDKIKASINQLANKLQELSDLEYEKVKEKFK